MKAKFKPVLSQVDFPALEREILDYWDKKGIAERYLKRNENSDKKFSFLDGPKTANNPLGVHHAWGRIYKDLWQRFYNMKGYKQRFQNGFDEQGLWVEVEVEKTLGLKSKKDIENIVLGDKLASLEKFIELCKERIIKYGDVITDQSKRLGQFMDWDNSYHTSSDQNNYMIWYFLKDVFSKGWLYKGRDSVPWCPRCGTAISQHEMQTEDYKELTHDSIYIEYPIVGRKNEYLLVWTTTPWTLPANVVIAVDPEKEYVAAVGSVAGNTYYLGKEAAKRLGLKIKNELTGSDLVGFKYISPFDHLSRIKKSLGDFKHQVVATDSVIMPITESEGTGMVHTAPGAGTEDFQIGKKLNLPVIDVINEGAVYLDGMDEFSFQNAKDNPDLIINFLKEKNGGEFLFDVMPYIHRYPVCWRCKTELVWRVVDEWYIAVDKKDPNSKETFRQKMIKVAKEMVWQPKFVEKRELDWLGNLHDWLISKKRYWGLALPIWVCTQCDNFEVVGGFNELKEKATEGWDKFEGHSPHRPWIDEIKLKCSKCGAVSTRVPDVGNPWLDAGIVPFSTITPVAGEVPNYLTDKKYWREWFPPDFSVEMYEQTRLWFYAMIAMSSDLEGKTPVKRIFGHGRVVDEKGEEMHGSKGNAVSLDEAFDRVGADAMRWLYLAANPGVDLRFGYNLINHTKKRFILMLWNCYKFFVDYVLLSDWQYGSEEKVDLAVLDRWILARLNELIEKVNAGLVKYDAASSSRLIEDFVVNDLSTWYIRRSRERVGPSADPLDQQAFLATAYQVLVTLTKLLAPFMPFISEEMYTNLTGDKSVHLQDYPEVNKTFLNSELVEDMKKVKLLVETGHAQRKEAGIKLRQPLGKFTYSTDTKLKKDLEQIMAEELNVKLIEYIKSSKGKFEVKLDTKITRDLQAEGEARDLIRQIQTLRKDQGLTLKDKVRVTAPDVPDSEDLMKLVLKQTNAIEIVQGGQLTVEVVR